MPTSRSPFGVTIAPLPFPDFQTDINKQLSFWNTMQQMQRRAAGISGGGSRVPRDENGLTPYQRMQFEEKRRKEEAKAAEAEAKKNVMLGLDPVSKEPIVYRNESGQNLTQKDRDRLLADELQRRLKNAAGQDVELNKALGELNSGTELSTQRRSELQRVVRDRTKALGREYGIDDRATFDAIIGPSKQVLDEQRQALRNDSFLDTVWAGMRKGGNALYYAATMPFMSDAERLEAAEQMRKEQEAITRSSPTLQERALVEAEAAREGKDVGYMQAAQANLASNIGASVADTVTSFAPAIAAGMIPIVGTYAAPLLAGGIGAGLNQVSQAARVEADPNLTEAQKQQALSYSDPGFVATTGVGGVTGLLMPGGVGSGIVRGAGNAAFRRAAAAGPINPATVPGLTGRALRAGARATERAQAPRSLAALSRDVPVNMAENAGLMAANTVGANMAYNASVGQPFTQGAMEGVGRAAMEGAIVGVPFGIGRTLRRRSAPRAQATIEGAAPASTPEAQQTAVETSRQLDSWRAELSKAVNAKTVDEAAANRLIAEYLDAGTPETVSSRLDELRNIPVGKGLTPKGKRAIGDLIKNYWEGALNDGTIAEKIASNYQRPAEGESGLTANMGEPERVRAERAAGQDTRDDSSMEADSAKRASDAASGDSVQGDASNSETPGGGDGGPAAQNGGPTKAPSAASPQEGREGTPASQQPANAGSPRPSSVEAGDGTRVITLAPERRDGSKSNAATTSGSEQPVSWTIIPETLKGTDGKPHKDAYVNGAGKQFETVINQVTGTRYAKVNGKWRRLDGKKGYPATLAAQVEIRNVLEAAKSTNPKGEIRESRFLPRQQYSSAGTSRNQIPESFKKIAWTQGTRNLDIGAGAFELGTDYLRSRGVENTPFDPYNRTTDVNNAALDTLRNGEKYDTVTVANLLNVVQEPEIRDNIIKQAAHSVKPDGKAYFQVYESDRSGVGRQTRTGGTDDNWQNARTLKSYQPDIERHFGKVESKDGMLIASEPKDPGPVEWQLNRDGDTVREAREGSNPLHASLRKLFQTPEEKAVLAALDTGYKDVKYIKNIKRAGEIILSKLPGLKPRKVKVFLEYDNPQRGGYYDPNTGEIGLNLAEMNDAAAVLHFMEHELRHAGLEELSNPSLRTYTTESVYNDSITPARDRVRYLYGDRDTAFLGEELYAEMPVSIDTTNGTIHNAILDIYGQNNTGQTAQQVQAALEFFSQNASEGTFATVAKDAILSSKQHVDLFTAGDAVSIDNPLAAKMVADYQSLTDIAGVPRNKETLGLYLDELLDPETELNVFKRQSVVC